MTPQKQYPKFYSHPHYWINAIEVEVNCDTTGTYRIIKKGEIFQLSALTVHEFQSMSALQNLTPKFEPQEGEAFIKDLEAAVSAGIKDKAELWEDTIISKSSGNPVWYVIRLKTADFWVEVKVSVGNISQVVVGGMLLDATYNDNLGAYCFDTAAYVDKLRELGYDI